MRSMTVDVSVLFLVCKKHTLDHYNMSVP